MKVYGMVGQIPTEYKPKEGMVLFTFKYANYLVPEMELVPEPEYNNPDLMNELQQYPVRSGYITYNP